MNVILYFRSNECLTRQSTVLTIGALTVTTKRSRGVKPREPRSCQLERLRLGAWEPVSPAKGQLAAEENMAELEKIVEGADLIFITAGMVRKNIAIQTKEDEFLNACSRTFILPTYNAKRPTRSGRWHRIGGCSGGRPNGAVGRGAHDWDRHQALRL